MIAAMLLAATAPAWIVTERADEITDQKFVTVISEQGNNLISIKCIQGEKRFVVWVINGMNMGGAPMLRSGVVRVDALKPQTHFFSFIDFVAESESPTLAGEILSAKTKVFFRLEKSRRDFGAFDVAFDATRLPQASISFKKKCLALGFAAP